MRVTVSSPAHATQIAPAPNVIPVGWLPTLMAAPRGPAANVSGLKRSTVAPPEFATQTRPAATTTPAGAAPADVPRVTPALRGFTRTRVESP